MNYPGGIKHKIKNDKTTTINTNYGNRGMTLENELNSSNDYYRLIDKAIIYKKPTPIKITNVDYPSRDKAVIKEAYFTVPSTTDYNGIYKGKYFSIILLIIIWYTKLTNNTFNVIIYIYKGLVIICIKIR